MFLRVNSMSLSKSNYITIMGFMVIPVEEGGLGLKGNEAIVFATIYGFSQDGKSWFEGTQRYLAEWCGSTIRGIQKNLNSLIEKGFIEKENVDIHGVTLCRYRASNNTLLFRSSPPTNKVRTPHEQSSHHIYIDNNTPSDIDTNVSISSPPKGAVAEIVDYLNARTGKHFLATTKATQRKINARLREGRTIDDFMRVIDIKASEWLGTQWDKFLSPDTLFGEKFERYLNQMPEPNDYDTEYPDYD